MQKEIELQDKNKIIINISPGYCTNVVNINKGYFKDNKLIKGISFSIWDDISIRAWTFEDNIDKLEFIFDINDPIYFSLNRLLLGESEFIIDDDDTCSLMNKYLVIKKELDTIKITFFNLLKDKRKHELFGVFIKNIGPDPRSKVDDFNKKIRLVRFFRDLEKILLEENHQISYDEYLETIRIDENKKVLKKI